MHIPHLFGNQTFYPLVQRIARAEIQHRRLLATQLQLPQHRPAVA